MPRRVQDARFNTAAFTPDRLDLQGLRHGPHPLDSMGCALTTSDADLYGSDAGRVARHASSKFARNRNYVALHLRGGDGEFRRRFHQTVRNAFKELITSYLARRKKMTAEVLPVPLYVASDTSYRSSANLGRAWRA